uniref:F-box protein At4g22390-like n=1 Tax=Erigeron canadensis TaxID=72917 RepID=UPI001CB9ADDC|nr:F-box protein At4g22390-like [Erigeron canadensis]
MRSLSKTWNSLLSHPSFIESHLNRSKGTNDAILLINEDEGVIYNWFPVHVFSVIKGSWEPITERFPSHALAIRKINEVFVDGHDDRLHYLCLVTYHADWTEETIVAFDLGDETFSEMSLPDWGHDYRRENELGFLSQKLCVMSCIGNGDCEVWVMENYEVATSWVKRYVVPKYDGDNIIPIGFTLNSEFVFEHGIHLALLVWPVTLTKWAYNNDDGCKSSSQIEKKQDLDD